MAEVTIRDLRNHGGDVIRRASAGELITITRDGTPVAELRPIRPPRFGAEALVAAFRDLPPVDPARLRADLDSIVDQSL